MRDSEAGRTVPAEGVPRLLAGVRQADRQVKSEAVAVVMGNRPRVTRSEVRIRV
jgi:hypothetical protein